MPSIEVILSAYNQPEFLETVLGGYLLQTDPRFSIAIADDGSGPEVAAVVERFSAQGLALRHVWQDDRGYRKCRIVNRALEGCEADYVVLSDSDCIPAPHFVEDHLTLARDGRFVCGRKVELGAEVTAGLMDGSVQPELLHRWTWLVRQDLSGRVDRSRYAFRLPDVLARIVGVRNRGGAWGANLAVWREDLLRVNGLDTQFDGGWGGEDVDLEWRLGRAGVSPIIIRGRATVFHLFHARRQPGVGFGDMLADKRAAGRWRVQSGIVEDPGNE